MEALKILLLCIGAAIAYGIVHDQITARICVEYFTVGHPPILRGTENPTLLAFGWGVIATWWAGLILGVPGAILARIGSRPKLRWRNLCGPIVVLMAVMAVSALVAGVFGYMATGFLGYYHPDDVRSSQRYQADAAAHGASYAVGFVGGVLLWAWIWWRRGRLERRLLIEEIDQLRRDKEELLRQLQNKSARET